MADDASHASGGAASAASATKPKRRRSSSQDSAGEGGSKKQRQSLLTASGGVKQLLKPDRTAMEIGVLIKEHTRKSRWVGSGLIWWPGGCRWGCYPSTPFPPHHNPSHSTSTQGGLPQAHQV